METINLLTTDKGDKVAFIPRAIYEAATSPDLDDDSVVLRLIAESNAAIERGDDIDLPREIWLQLEAQENPTRVLRQYRKMTQANLSEASGLSQVHLSNIERGEREGTVSTMKAIAKALSVPLSLLIDDHGPSPDLPDGEENVV